MTRVVNLESSRCYIHAAGLNVGARWPFRQATSNLRFIYALREEISREFIAQQGIYTAEARVQGSRGNNEARIIADN